MKLIQIIFLISVLIISSCTNSIEEDRYDTGELKAYGRENSKGRQGVWIGFYKTGKPEAMGYFKDGKLEGKLYQFYQNGKIKRISNFKDGKAEGWEILWYANGKKQEEGNYKDDKRVDIWCYYDSISGEIVEELDYMEGDVAPFVYFQF